MRLKDGLFLREVAGQYVIIPTGKRVREVTNIVYISSSAAYLWEYMKDHEFEKEDLVERLLDHYTGVTREKASEDVGRFLKILSDNNILDDGIIRVQTATFCGQQGRISRTVQAILSGQPGISAGQRVLRPTDQYCSLFQEKAMLSQSVQ